MTNASLERFLSRAPDVVDLLKDVPNVPTRLRRLLGPHAEPTWNTDDPSALTLLFLIAGVVEQARLRDERIHSLEEERVQLEEKLETVRAAELNWQALAATRDGITFTNATGQTVTISRNFLQAFVDHHQLDVSSIEERGCDIVVLNGEEVIVQLPKSLWVVLHSVLDHCSWFPGQP